MLYYLPKASEYMMPAVLVEDETMTMTFLFVPVPFILRVTPPDLQPLRSECRINMFITYLHFFLHSVNCLVLFPLRIQ